MKTLLATAALTFATAAQAHLTLFSGTFAPEAPGATGTGTLSMEYDEDARTLFIDATWSGLSGTTSTAHIHCCTALPNTGTAGVALATGGILPGFPLGVSSGSYTRLIDLSLTSNYSSGFVTSSAGFGGLTDPDEAAEARLIANLSSGQAYFNIHSTTFGSGEIRSFVTVVPEPGSWALMALGLAGIAGVARRRSGLQAA
jgi:hypothetical protein